MTQGPREVPAARPQPRRGPRRVIKRSRDRRSQGDRRRVKVRPPEAEAAGRRKPDGTGKSERLGAAGKKASGTGHREGKARPCRAGAPVAPSTAAERPRVARAELLKGSLPGDERASAHGGRDSPRGNLLQGRYAGRPGGSPARGAGDHGPPCPARRRSARSNRGSPGAGGWRGGGM